MFRLALISRSSAIQTSGRQEAVWVLVGVPTILAALAVYLAGAERAK
ncbi:MAG: hypothetical protein GYA29_05360 [Methanothrix sp.]|jgi:hypothetical protein|nr:hypothetical protein [Methanothrix sp.]